MYRRIIIRSRHVVSRSRTMLLLRNYITLGVNLQRLCMLSKHMLRLPLDLIEDQALHLYRSIHQAKVVLETWQNTTVHQDLGTLEELVMDIAQRGIKRFTTLKPISANLAQKRALK